MKERILKTVVTICIGIIAYRVMVASICSEIDSECWAKPHTYSLTVIIAGVIAVIAASETTEQ